MNKHYFKILIVEDESLVAFAMKEMLHELGYNTIQIAGNQSLAELIINETKLNLVILDINLGKGNEGLYLAKICKQKAIPFFYVSSYTDKPTLDKAIETTPGAYLIKPFIQSNLYTALQITISTANQKEVSIYQFKDGTNHVSLKTNEIIFVMAENIYVKIATASRNYLIRNSLASVLEELPHDKFIQVHRSYIINLDYLTKVTAETIELGEITVPLSRTYKPMLKEKLSFA